MGILRVKATWTSGQGGGPYLTQLYFMTAGANGTQTEANDAVTAVGTFLGAIDAQVQTGTNWSTDPEVEDINAAGVLLGTFITTPQSGAGAASGQAFPPATQGFINWRTNLVVNGRTLRGRTFIPNVPITQGSGANPSSTYQTLLTNAANAMIADASTMFAIWSKTHSTVTQASAGVAGTKWAVLRSRRD